MFVLVIDCECVCFGDCLCVCFGDCLCLCLVIVCVSQLQWCVDVPDKKLCESSKRPRS